MCYDKNPSGIRLQVRVTPRASRTRLEGLRGDRLAIRLNAPPVEGAANAACARLLAESFDVAASRVRLTSGERSREKTFQIDGDPNQLEERLKPLLKVKEA